MLASNHVCAVLVVQLLDFLLQGFWILDGANHLLQIVLHTFDQGFQVSARPALQRHFPRQPRLLELEVRNEQVQPTVGLVVPLQLTIHLLDLVLHLKDLSFPGLNLLLELLDFVIQHKLELLQLLVLLLEVIDAPLLVPNGLIPLPDLTLEGRNVFLQRRNGSVQLPFLLEEVLDLLLLGLNVLLQRVELLAHDAILSFQP
mmetsp:Transcript_22834/g.63116  ORF Transcript_22834/g.63116 Transcript_22834/m.63116 type:complete len:201 (-) Transcript_22834:2691-3293(-)